ncbi:uncharacterized protein C8A04DRAFT_29617 [Dichotomopilus funicola]|uniref:NACHT domain-containing protein n=1 Tax=Dichotomopilus funicola TaxID=1934379 RepID=A0AAN6V256_9PEZI|nr:hypothetical protein C8A04DRAFT_29617 [Dichotomopilus funicola]
MGLIYSDPAHEVIGLRGPTLSAPAYRRPSSTLAPSPRYLGRDRSRYSSFDTSPLAASSPGLVYHQDIILVACEIWEHAYNQVKCDESLQPLVSNYEKLFAAATKGKTTTHRRPSFVQLDPASDDDERSSIGEHGFTRLAQEHVEMVRKESAHQGIVSSAIQFIQKTRDVVGLALSASPPASLAWTGICTIVLPVIVNHAEQIAARESGFAYVMSRFTWYGQVLDLLNREYWKSPQSFSALRHSIYDEIVALYKLLIEYHLRAYYTYCRPLTTLSRDILKLDDWECMLSEIKESEKRLEEYMTLNYEQHLLDKLHTLSEDALHKQRIETLLKFKFPDDLPYAVYQAYLDSIDSPQDGTGAGVLTHPSFVAWAANSSGAFILEGIPGSGKSVLSKCLLTELRKWRNTTVCGFFFKDNGKGQNASTTALCRVLDELFREQPHLVDGVSYRIDHLLPEEVRCNFDLLWDVLEEATQDCDPGSVTVVLDAFDECDLDSGTKLCQKITHYLANPEARIKFFLTLRPPVSASPLMSSPHATILRLEEDPHCLRHISKDIEQVVVARFDGFALRCIQDPALRQELLEMIRPKEDRTYLYVKLLFDYLDLKLRDGIPRVPRGWIEVFKKLPATVKEAYVGILSRVRESQRDDVKRLFQLVLAATRPLTLQEINVALNIRDLPNGSKHGLGLQDEGCFRSWILDACKYFLDVYNGRVYFIHQTAKDFLLAGSGDNGHRKPDWLGEVTMQGCHKIMAESCILYLSLPLSVPSRFKGVDNPSESTVEYHRWDYAELTFANYAHFFWHHHVHQVVAGDQPDVNQLNLRITEDLRKWYQGMLLMPQIQVNVPDILQRLAALVRAVATFHAVRSLTRYQPHSPLPAEWFTVRFFNKTSGQHHNEKGRQLQSHDGDTLSYVITNRTEIHPAYVHMLSLNSSWRINTLLWNVRVPPRQQRTGDLTMLLPPKVREDDPQDAEDIIIVIFCVGEQFSEQMVSSTEWLRSLYVPPVLLDPGAKAGEVPVWPFFVPPPNWVIKHISVRTVPRV